MTTNRALPPLSVQVVSGTVCKVTLLVEVPEPIMRRYNQLTAATGKTIEDQVRFLVEYHHPLDGDAEGMQGIVEDLCWPDWAELSDLAWAGRLMSEALEWDWNALDEVESEEDFRAQTRAWFEGDDVAWGAACEAALAHDGARLRGVVKPIWDAYRASESRDDSREEP